MFKRELLRQAVDSGVEQSYPLARAIARPSDRDDPQAADALRINHCLRAIVIGRNHRSAISSDQLAKQPELGVQVMLYIRMVIHVIARQIGEAAGSDAHAVQPILIEAVR